VALFTGFGPESNEDPGTAIAFALLTAVGVAALIAAAVAAFRWARGSPSHLARVLVVVAALLVVVAVGLGVRFYI